MPQLLARIICRLIILMIQNDIWLLQTIDDCIVLELLGYEIDLSQLRPYAHYSKQLQFMLDPEGFDCSLVDTDQYMWQNLIYSRKYAPYIIEHKQDILSSGLKEIFDMGRATTEQQKIVYGILLNDDELQAF